jgi:3D (Asp-Asp-Asp) domain-containing protein
MRILATLILVAVLSAVSPVAKAAETAQDSNQNTKQTLIKNTNTLEDNFLLAIYTPKVENMKLLGFYQAKRPVEPVAEQKESFTINASAYTAAADECGKSDGITASGKMVQANHTLACPKMYKMGTKIEIEGMGTYVCEDRGGAIKGNHFDIYMPTKKEAFSFGRRNLLAMVVE